MKDTEGGKGLGLNEALEELGRKGLAGAELSKALNDNEKNIASYWNNRAGTYEQDHKIAEQKSWEAFFEEVIGKERDIAVLDVATGTGIIANLLAEMGYKTVVGTDISDGMMKIAIGHAEKAGLKNVKYVYGNALELPFEDESFDVIVNSRLLWTILEPNRAVSEWHRALKKGGRIIAMNEMKPEKGIAYDNIGEYMKNINVDKLPYCPAGTEDIKNDFINNGFNNVSLKHMKGCRTVVSEEENWYAFTGEK